MALAARRGSTTWFAAMTRRATGNPVLRYSRSKTSARILAPKLLPFVSCSVTCAAINQMTPDTTREAARVVWEYWCSGGWLMLPLACAAFLIFHRYLTLRSMLRGALAGPSDCVDVIESKLREELPAASILSWLADMPGAVPRVIRHVLPRTQAGLPFPEAFTQCRDGELAPYSHGFYVLGALVVAAPMLGLLGTVLGMIDTFDAVAIRSGETGQMVAGGISQALITTQVGLAAALPGTFGLAHLFRLYQRLRHEIDRCESHLFIFLVKRANNDPQLACAAQVGGAPQ